MNKESLVLVVEDDPALRDALHEKLVHSGYTVLVAENGEEGLQQALTHKPDVMLLDMMMPKMDGLETLKKLRDDEWGKGAKVIMLTNVDDNGKVADALDEGVTEYLLKNNFSLEEIVAKVDERLGVTR